MSDVISDVERPRNDGRGTFAARASFAFPPSWSDFSRWASAAASGERLSPNCGPPFLPLRQKRTDIDANYVYH